MISKSNERMTFQQTKYIERCKENNEEPDPNYLAMFADDIHRHDIRFDTPESKVNNMEYDLLTTDWILEKVRVSDVYAQNLYAAMCNNDFVKNDVWPLLKEEKWSCSWRRAGGIIADMRQKGDYIDWYCSGIRDTLLNDDSTKEYTEEQKKRLEITDKYVSESAVTEEIRNDLLKLGWLVIQDDSTGI